jgi:hypothetical protein
MDAETAKKLQLIAAEMHELHAKLGDSIPFDEKIAARINELGNEHFRIIGLSRGLSEAEITEINHRSSVEADAETRAQIDREVKVGLALFEQACRGDTQAIARLRKGCFEFAVAIGEKAISEADLQKLRDGIAFATAAFTAFKTKH